MALLSWYSAYRCFQGRFKRRFYRRCTRGEISEDEQDQGLLEELKKGKKGKPLKAIEVLSHTHELLELGETITSIKKTGAKPVKADLNAEDMEIVEATQKEYGFREDAWKMLGVSLGGAKSAPKAKAAVKKKTAKRGRRKKTT